MSTLFDGEQSAGRELITEIDGVPYMLDIHLHRFVPYGNVGGIRWAATTYLDKPNAGSVLWHYARLSGTTRAINYAALNEGQAIFLAARAALAFDKIEAAERIAAAFADWRAHHPAVEPDTAAPIEVNGLAPTLIAPGPSTVAAIVQAIGLENDALERLLDQRASLDDRINSNRKMLGELSAQLPSYLKLIPA